MKKQKIIGRIGIGAAILAVLLCMFLFGFVGSAQPVAADDGVLTNQESFAADASASVERTDGSTAACGHEEVFSHADAIPLSVTGGGRFLADIII